MSRTTPSRGCTRRGLLGLACSFGFRAPASPGSPHVLVIVPERMEPYQQALEGMRQEAAGQPFVWSELKLSGNGDEVYGAVSRLHPALVVAVGSEALEAACARAPGVPVIAAVVLNAGSGAVRRKPLSVVSAELPLATTLEAARAYIPAGARVGVIRGASSAAVKVDAKVVVADCAGAED